MQKVSTSTRSLRRDLGIDLSPGAMEGLKWFALACMVLDHANRILLNGTALWMGDLGRMALPLFGFLLAHNLARPGALESGVYRRVVLRLLAAGVAATPLYVCAFHPVAGWWPLNILLLFLLFVGIVWLIDLGNAMAVYGVAVFIIGGALVEYVWIGLAYCLCAFWFCRRKTRLALMGWLLSTALLGILNRNLWAMAALPLLFLAQHINVAVPRIKHLFYAMYPLHLLALLLLKQIAYL
jgi:hypothetical protein